MNAGALRHIIIFEHDTNAQLASNSQDRDSFGAVTENWVEAFRVPGRFTYKAGSEADDSTGTMEVRKRRGTTTGEVLIRYKSGIDPAIHRIRFDGQAWNISPPIPDEKNTQQIIDVDLVI